MGLARRQAQLGGGVNELGGGAEVCHFLDFGVVEQDLAAGSEGRTVVEQQRGAGGEARDQPVPHHPAAGGEVEQPVAGAHVAVQLVFLEVLQQHAAMAMDDALGHAGGAGGEHDEQRVIEGDPSENRGVFRVDRGQVVPLHRIGDGAGFRPLGQIGHNHGLHQRRHFGDDLGILFQAVDLLAVVPVAVDADQHFRLDLPEAVEHALHAKVW